MDTEALGRKALTDTLKVANLKASHISKLVNGHVNPTIDLANQIEEVTGLPAAFWLGDKTTRPARMWAHIQEGMR
jgi:plasmid maintenance system antidote protein VapI